MKNLIHRLTKPKLEKLHDERASLESLLKHWTKWEADGTVFVLEAQGARKARLAVIELEIARIDSETYRKTP